MAATRIYAVQDLATKRLRLVEATNPAQARGHCARNQYVVDVATQKQLVALMSAGARVEKAGDELDTTGDLPGIAPSGSEPAKGGDDGNKK